MTGPASGSATGDDNPGFVARHSAFRLLPVALLLLGIAVHGVQIVAFDNDPQRGSAFAMFATIDVGATRSVQATVPGEVAVALDLPDSVQGRVSSLVDSPSDEAARDLADELRSMTWTVTGATASVGDDTQFDQVRVQVVGLGAEGRTIVRQVLVDVVVSGPGS